MKYDWKFKLQCVEDYKKGIWTKKPDYAKCSDHDFHHKITDWVRTFDLYGTDGLRHKQINKEWTPEERYELVAKVLAGKSNNSVAIEAGIDQGQLYKWVRRYKLYGCGGLKLKKGRKPEKPVMKDDNKPKDLTKSEKEELILLRRQNEYLKAENAYLKKLRALIVQKKAESSLKAKKEGSSKNSVKKDTD